MKTNYLFLLVLLLPMMISAMGGGSGAGRSPERVIRPYVPSPAQRNSGKAEAGDRDAIERIIGLECLKQKKVAGETVEGHLCASFLAPNPIAAAQRFMERQDESAVDCIGFRTTCQTQVCKVGEDVVGLISYDLLDRTLKFGPISYDGGTVARISLLAVAQSHRQKGHGKALLEAALADVASKRACDTMIAFRHDDEIMAKLCQSLGFEQAYPIGDDTVYLYTQKNQ